MSRGFAGEVTSPVTTARLAEALHRHGELFSAVGDDFGGYWAGRHMFFAAIRGTAGDELHLQARWNPDLPADHEATLLRFANDFSAAHATPTITIQPVAGGIAVTTTVVTDIGAGLTDDQLARALTRGIEAATAVFTAMDGRYPDIAEAAEAAF